jgi:hypothetical protein
VTTLGLIERGIELDLSNFNQVKVDAKANKLTVGGAVRFGDILIPMGKAHKELREYSRLADRVYQLLTPTKRSEQIGV